MIINTQFLNFLNWSALQKEGKFFVSCWINFDSRDGSTRFSETLSCLCVLCHWPWFWSCYSGRWGPLFFSLFFEFLQFLICFLWRPILRSESCPIIVTSCFFLILFESLIIYLLILQFDGFSCSFDWFFIFNFYFANYSMIVASARSEVQKWPYNFRVFNNSIWFP